MKKLSITMSDKEYFDLISNKINGKDLFDCGYDDLYNFSKKTVQAIASCIPENPPIEVGDVVVKTGGVYNEIYGIVTHKESDVCSVMFNDGHVIAVLESGLHPTGSNYKCLLTEVFERIKEGVRSSIKRGD